MPPMARRAPAVAWRAEIEVDDGRLLVGDLNKYSFYPTRDELRLYLTKDDLTAVANAMHLNDVDRVALSIPLATESVCVNLG